ncbi:MAG: GMC family oxidoreductase [Spirochaetales bacterium]|nr:GMC family oxidoreductase [Spirochaetales bacterium]
MQAVVIGSGAGGAVAARELALRGIKTTVLEAGKAFRPLSRNIAKIRALRGFMFSEKLISLVFPPMKTYRTEQGLVLIRGISVGGCTTISCGNLLRAEKGMRELGLDLTPEYQHIEELLKPTPVPVKRWRPTTRAMYAAAQDLGLAPFAPSKAVSLARCVSCGLCELGCAARARWDASRFINDALKQGAQLITGARVTRILHHSMEATGVEYIHQRKKQQLPADIIVLAAGGIGTAALLHASGIENTPFFWGDIVLTLGGKKKNADQLHELPMVWCVQKDHYIISPYIDILSHFFHRPWRNVSLRDRVGVMVKLADTPNGRIQSPRDITKHITDLDYKRLDQGIAIASEIMQRAGVKGPFTRGILNAGHFGGTASLTKQDVPGMRPAWLPRRLWVADLSLLPSSQGLPTMLTTMALSLRVVRTALSHPA